jgi:hypothetical protein
MSEYEYKKVEGMSVGQVVDKILSGEDFYIIGQDETATLIEFDVYDVFGIDRMLKNGWINTRTEKPWWVGCEGSVIMVRDTNSQPWRPNIFEKYLENDECCFVCPTETFYQARPLTSAERDAIKVRD